MLPRQHLIPTTTSFPTQRSIRMAESEYVDFDLFLDPEFSAVGFANTLVQATNNTSDIEVDLDTPAKRLDYDLEEVDKIINTTSGENYEQLLDQASNVKLAEESLEPMKKNLEQVNFSYSKLQNDVLKPYDKAEQIYTALKKLHLTSSLLRSLTWYLYLARQLSNIGTNASSSELYNAALNLRQVRNQVEINPGLQSLHIIRSHEKTLKEVEQSIRNQAQSKIKFFNLLYDTTSLAPACLALYLLDPDALALAVSNFLRNQVSSSVTQFSKALGAPIPSFERAANDSKDRAKVLSSLMNTLDRKPPSPEEEPELEQQLDDQFTLLTYIKSSLDIRNPISSYWRDVASGLDGRVREFVMRSPGQAKSMTQNITQLKQAIQNAVIEGEGVDVSGPEVKVMINSLSPLSR